MFKRLLTAALAVLVTMTFTGIAEEETKIQYVSAQSGLRLHTEASLDSEVITVAALNQEVTVLEMDANGEFARVTFEVDGVTYEGWIWIGFLSDTPIEIAEEEEKTETRKSSGTSAKKEEEPEEEAPHYEPPSSMPEEEEEPAEEEEEPSEKEEEEPVEEEEEVEIPEKEIIEEEPPEEEPPEEEEEIVEVKKEEINFN